MLYTVGMTYETDGYIEVCTRGYHYCVDIDDVFTYYPYKKGITKIFEIEDLGCGESKEDKSVTNKIKIVREIPLSEWNSIMKRHVFDDRGNLTMRQNKHSKYWKKWTYDADERIIAYKNSDGYGYTCSYDADGNEKEFQEIKC